LNGYLANAVNGIIGRSISPDTAAETLTQGAAQVLSRYAIPVN